MVGFVALATTELSLDWKRKDKTHARSQNLKFESKASCRRRQKGVLAFSFPQMRLRHKYTSFIFSSPHLLAVTFQIWLF